MPAQQEKRQPRPLLTCCVARPMVKVTIKKRTAAVGCGPSVRSRKGVLSVRGCWQREVVVKLCSEPMLQAHLFSSARLLKGNHDEKEGDKQPQTYWGMSISGGTHESCKAAGHAALGPRCASGGSGLMCPMRAQHLADGAQPRCLWYTGSVAAHESVSVPWVPSACRRWRMTPPEFGCGGRIASGYANPDETASPYHEWRGR